MDEEIIVPFGCSPQVCVEEALLKHTSVEVQESSTYQRYLSIRQEVLLIQDRVNKAVRDFEELDSGKDELKEIQEDIQEHLGEIIHRYDQTQTFRDNVFEQFQEFCDSEGKLSSKFEDDVYETAETLQKAVNNADMTQMVGYYRKELADLGDIHEALLKLLLANVQHEQDSAEKFKKAYKDAFGEKDSRYERLMEMYTQEAMTQQKSSRDQKSLSEMVEELKLINGHLQQLRDEDKLKIASLLSDLDSKNSTILSLQQSLAKLTAETKKVPRTQNASAVPVVVNGGPQRKVSNSLPPLGPASGGRQRKVSRSTFPPSAPPSLEGDRQKKLSSSAMPPPIAPWMAKEDKSVKEAESKADKKKGKGGKQAKNVESDSAGASRKVSVNHIARQLEKHLDDLEEVVATREQRMTAVSRLTQRRAEQVKASLKTQCTRIQQCVQKNVAFIARNLPSDISVGHLESLVESLMAVGDVLKGPRRMSGDSVSVFEEFSQKLNEVYADIVDEVHDVVSEGRDTMGTKAVKTCKSALKTMQEAVKPLQRQIVQEMKQLKGHMDQVNKRKAEISKGSQAQKSQNLQQVEKLLEKLNTHEGLQESEKDRLRQLKELAGRLVSVQVINFEPNLMRKDLESLRKGAAEFFKRKAGVQTAYQSTALRPGSASTARKVTVGRHGEVSHHTKQQPQTHGLVKHPDTPEYALSTDGDAPSNFNPASSQPTSVSTLRPWHRRHGPVTGNSSPHQLGLDTVQSINDTPQKLLIMGVPMLSVLQECSEEAEHGGVLRTRQHSQSLQRPLISPDNVTAMELLKEAADFSKSHRFGSLSIDLSHVKDELQEEGYSTAHGHGWPPRSQNPHLSRLLPQQSFRRKQGYMFPNPSNSHNEVGVEPAGWYANEGVKQEEIAATHDTSWLPSIQGNSLQAHCTCFPHRSATVRGQTVMDKSSCPFTIWSRSNSFMGLLNRTFPQTHVNYAMPLLPGNEDKAHVQATGSRMLGRLFYGGTQQSSQKLPAPVHCKNLLVVGRQPYYITETGCSSAKNKYPQVLQPHSLL